MKEKIKSFNKILKLTSLFSVAMLISPFSVDAADSKGEATSNPVPYLNNNVNYTYPKTSNDKAVYANVKSEKDDFFLEPGGQNYCFKVNGKCINCATSDTDTARCMVLSSTNSSSDSYTLPNNTSGLENKIRSDGYMVSGSEYKMGEGGNGFGGCFFRYWDSDAKTKNSDYTGAYSAAYPKICYRGIKNTVEGMKPIIAAIDAKKIAYGIDGKDITFMDLAVKEVPNYNVTNPTVKQTNLKGGNIVSVKSFSGSGIPGGACLVPIVYTASGECANYEREKYSYETQNCGGVLGRCGDASKSCSKDEVKVFHSDNAGKNTYRESAYVYADISGNNESYAFEIPYNTCFKCGKIDSGEIEAACSVIVKEVFEKTGKDCAKTVKILATNLSTSNVDRFKTYTTGVPCGSCLTKIEGILKGPGFGCK